MGAAGGSAGEAGGGAGMGAVVFIQRVGANQCQFVVEPEFKLTI